jgi:hypothetical protein
VKIVIISVKLEPQGPYYFLNIFYKFSLQFWRIYNAVRHHNNAAKPGEYSHARQHFLLQILTIGLQLIQADIED